MISIARNIDAIKTPAGLGSHKDVNIYHSFEAIGELLQICLCYYDEQFNQKRSPRNR